VWRKDDVEAQHRSGHTGRCEVGDNKCATCERVAELEKAKEVWREQASLLRNDRDSEARAYRHMRTHAARVELQLVRTQQREASLRARLLQFKTIRAEQWLKHCEAERDGA